VSHFAPVSRANVNRASNPSQLRQYVLTDATWRSFNAPHRSQYFSSYLMLSMPRPPLRFRAHDKSPATRSRFFLGTVHRARFSYDDLLAMTCLFAALRQSADRQPTTRSSCRRVK